jgi:catechol 2,3-dioxygenase-like lactoylglutathione lyase family enzyme
MDWKLEVVLLPVADVDRAKEFYTTRVGFHLDVDHRSGDTFRVVQLTPHGSACSITFGVGLGTGEPGSVKGLHLIVDDIEAAHAELAGRGVETGGIQHFEDGRPTPGPDPQRADFGSYVFFADPDGNTWAVQEVHHGNPERSSSERV